MNIINHYSLSGIEPQIYKVPTSFDLNTLKFDGTPGAVFTKGLSQILVLN